MVGLTRTAVAAVIVALLAGLFALPLAARGADRCAVPSDVKSGWSTSEQWAWSQLCQGVPADMRFAPSGGGKDARCKPDEIIDMAGSRLLRGTFLRDALVSLPVGDLYAPHPINIECGYVLGALDLYQARLNVDLQINNTVFWNFVDLEETKIAGSLRLDSSTILGKRTVPKDMRAPDRGDLVRGKFRTQNTARSLLLFRTTIGGDLFIHDSELSGGIDGSQANIAGSVILGPGTNLRRFVLPGSVIKRNLLFNEVKIEKEGLSLIGTTIKGSARFVVSDSRRGVTTVSGPHILGDVMLKPKGKTVSFSAENMTVEGSLISAYPAVGNSDTWVMIKLRETEVKRDLVVGSTGLQIFLSLSNVTVGNTLHFGTEEAGSPNIRQFSATNTFINKLQTTATNWEWRQNESLRSRITLENAHFSTISRATVNGDPSFFQSDAGSVLKWLKEASHARYPDRFRPAVFAEFAAALHRSGLDAMAQAVTVEGYRLATLQQHGIRDLHYFSLAAPVLLAAGHGLDLWRLVLCLTGLGFLAVFVLHKSNAQKVKPFHSLVMLIIPLPMLLFVCRGKWKDFNILTRYMLYTTSYISLIMLLGILVLTYIKITNSLPLF